VQRNRVARVLESKPIDLKDPMRTVGDLAASTVAALEAVDWKAMPADTVSPKKPQLPLKP
jgi:hypothetical protein